MTSILPRRFGARLPALTILWLAASPLLAGCSYEPPPSAPLVRDAQPNPGAFDDTPLRRRLLAAFPLGGPEKGLAAHLQRQGFEIRRLENAGATGDQIYGEAKLRWGGPLLGRRAFVYWRATKAGALTEIGAVVQDAGPLAALGEL
jgi:hypothetical protein